jgi:quercetin dioxygenase-like cupin family protein
MRLLCSLVAAALLAGPAFAQQPTTAPASTVPVFSIELDQVKWTKAANGLEFATLVGERTKPGLYIQLVRWPPNFINKAHSHPDDRYAMVLKGTFYHGYGDKFDETKLEKRPAGSYFTEPARLRHFGITKDEGTILYFVGTGPSTNDDPEK